MDRQRDDQQQRNEIRRVAHCPHCGNRAPQLLLHTQRFLEPTWGKDGEEAEPAPWSSFIVACETCGRILVYDNPGDALGEEQFHYGELEYPASGHLPGSVPSRVAAAYVEATRIRHIAPNAFAVQIRRALEALCQDRRAAGGSLYNRLDDLAKRGEIPPILAKMTDILRLLGNIGAHSSDQSVHPLQVRAIDDFFRAVIEYVYIAPSKIAKFERRQVKVPRTSESSWDDDDDS